MRAEISDTAEYGDYVSGRRVIGDASRAAMKEILDEIQSGAFARKWIEEARCGGREFERLREQERTHHHREGRGCASVAHGLAVSEEGKPAVADFSEKTDWIWKDGEIVPWDAGQLHVMSHVVHYGSSVFEGIRLYEDTRRSVHLSARRPCEALPRFRTDLSHAHERERRDPGRRRVVRSCEPTV